MTPSLLILAASPGFDQTAADIVEKMIEAQGGRKVLESIKDMTFVGSVEWEKMTGRLTIYRKEPNQFRREIEIMEMKKTDAFDGEIAWSIEANETSEKTGRAPASASSLFACWNESIIRNSFFCCACQAAK